MQDLYKLLDLLSALLDTIVKLAQSVLQCVLLELMVRQLDLLNLQNVPLALLEVTVLNLVLPHPLESVMLVTSVSQLQLLLDLTLLLLLLLVMPLWVANALLVDTVKSDLTSRVHAKEVTSTLTIVVKLFWIVNNAILVSIVLEKPQPPLLVCARLVIIVMLVLQLMINTLSDLVTSLELSQELYMIRQLLNKWP
jgi:hypothetical protein